MLSYWEQASLLRYDIIIIGSGIVGLNTAINLKEQYPGKEIVIFERGILPTGASTRNAGFACFGSVSELVDDLRTEPREALYSLFKRRKNGIDLLRKRLGDTAIGFRQDGSHELLQEHETDVLDAIDDLNVLLKDLDQNIIFSEAHDHIAAAGLSPAHFRYCIAANTEGSIDTGRMMKALMQLALSKGVIIKTGVQVTRFEEQADGVRVDAEDPLRGSVINFNCEKLVICTNAFTGHFFPDMDILPGRGQVLITRPVEGLRLKGIYHFDKGYYYFRELDGRVLLGGGRNLDFEGERTMQMGANNTIVEHLIYQLKHDILPGNHFEIDLQWSGIMAFGSSSKTPLLYKHSDRISGAFRLGGMGVALGSQLAIDLSRLVSE
ncbi:MAG: hypothetical protein BGO09_12210 [Bacteroidetes bacterium 47-18]|nr:MAG: hypothetical protein BGO09_12210 [Bacteroidetes bacterium 47-18]